MRKLLILLMLFISFSSFSQSDSTKVEKERYVYFGANFQKSLTDYGYNYGLNMHNYKGMIVVDFRKDHDLFEAHDGRHFEENFRHLKKHKGITSVNFNYLRNIKRQESPILKKWNLFVGGGLGYLHKTTYIKYCDIQSNEMHYVITNNKDMVSVRAMACLQYKNFGLMTSYDIGHHFLFGLNISFPEYHKK